MNKKKLKANKQANKQATKFYQKLKKTPVNNYLQKTSFAGRGTNEQMIDGLRKKYGLDMNQTLKIAKQYFGQFLKKG